MEIKHGGLCDAGSNVGPQPSTLQSAAVRVWIILTVRKEEAVWASLGFPNDFAPLFCGEEAVTGCCWHNRSLLFKRKQMVSVRVASEFTPGVTKGLLRVKKAAGTGMQCVGCTRSVLMWRQKRLPVEFYFLSQGRTKSRILKGEIIC